MSEDNYKWLERQIMKEAIQELRESLKEEKKKRKQDGIPYLFGCPYCNFQSRYFNRILLHNTINENCLQRWKKSPCYPILLNFPDGAPLP
ncbi:hypothetical protein [Candidatus Harpocratesius sp.]